MDELPPRVPVVKLDSENRIRCGTIPHLTCSPEKCACAIHTSVTTPVSQEKITMSVVKNEGDDDSMRQRASIFAGGDSDGHMTGGG